MYLLRHSVLRCAATGVLCANRRTEECQKKGQRVRKAEPGQRSDLRSARRHAGRRGTLQVCRRRPPAAPNEEVAHLLLSPKIRPPAAPPLPPLPVRRTPRPLDGHAARQLLWQSDQKPVDLFCRRRPAVAVLPSPSIQTPRARLLPERRGSPRHPLATASLAMRRS